MPKTILAVDDEQDIIDDIKATFKEHKVLPARDGRKALEVLKDADLVITAIDVGEVDGLKIIQEAKGKGIKTLVLSSRTDPGTVEMIKSYYKPDAYLQKPIDKAQLYTKVQELLSKRRLIPHEHLWTIIESLGDSIEQGIVILDADYRIVWLNKALESKGFIYDKVIGERSYQVFDSLAKPPEDGPTTKAFSEMRTFTEPKTGRDGHKYWLTSIPVIEDGQVLYVIEFGEDLEEKERRKKEIN